MDGLITLLLVEDNDNDAFFFDRAIAKAGLPLLLRRVSDGKEAIEYLTGEGRFADRYANPYPKFIVTDTSMPRVPGMEFLNWLKEHPRHKVIPTIVLGGTAEPNKVKEAYALGVHSYFVKPENVDELRNVITKIFDYWIVAVTPAAEAEQEGS